MRDLPFGTWPSPISPVQLAGDRSLSDVAWDGDTLVWHEARGGTGVLLAQRGDDAPRELTRELSVRAEVGYGGGDFTLHGGAAYFAAHKSGSLWRQPLAHGPARRLMPPHGAPASPAISPDGRFVVYVHHDGASDRLAVVDSDGRLWPQILADDHDFFMQPRFSPDGRCLAFVAWDHPRMPWEGSTLYVGTVLADGALPRLTDVRAVAGGERIAALQPEFAGAERLLYVSDESGWSHLWLHDLATGERRRLTDGEAEYGAPAWTQGLRTFAVGHDASYAVCIRNERGFARAERVELAGGQVTPIEALAPYSQLGQPAISERGSLACIVSSSTVPSRLVVVDGERVRIVARSSTEGIPAEALSLPEPLQFRSAGGTSHALFWPPASIEARCSGAPPAIVYVHGGPTAQARAAWSPRVQFFATRGWAVVEPNYRGSTGYGRAYMEQGRGAWGVADVEDSVAAVRHLAAAGRIDPRRVVIMGGSSGGLTVYLGLIHHPDVFAGGISFYGVTDLFALAKDTHKFEAHYNDWLVGALPEAAALYRERSPVFHAARIGRPMAIFQGDEDRVVPKSQSDAIVAALARHGLPHLYRVFAGEGHGFRKPESLTAWYAGMQSFLEEQILAAPPEPRPRARPKRPVPKRPAGRGRKSKIRRR